MKGMMRKDVSDAISAALADHSPLISISNFCAFRAYLDGTQGIETVPVTLDETNEDAVEVWDAIEIEMIADYGPPNTIGTGPEVDYGHME